MPTNDEISAYVDARWAEIRALREKMTLATLLWLAQAAREDYPHAAGIRLDASDQGDYMAYAAVLDANGNDLDPNGDFDDGDYCSGLDDGNAGTWEAFCIETDQSRRNNPEYVIQIDQVLAAGITLED